MKFAFSAILFTLAAAASATDVRYDTVYDNPNGQMTTVACSDGKNGLITRFNFQKFSDIPTFPNIGSAQAIASWNSTSCGTCWKLTFNGKSIFVTAIDHAGDGFVLSESAMNTLTNGQAVALGEVSATSTQVAASNCGLS